jgi:dihydropteridine reductase
MKATEQVDQSIIVEGNTWAEQERFVRDAVAAGLEGGLLDAVICVAGGWAGGSPASKDFVKNSEAMWRQSVWPASISAALATAHLREGGICVLPGAAPAVAGTPGMAGYGMAKAAVHQLAKSLACEGSGLPEGSSS